MADATDSRNKEIWKDIPDWEGVYQVSDRGRVRSLPRERVTSAGAKVFHKGQTLTPHIKNGYPAVNLRDSGRLARAYVHRLVAIAFLGSGDGCEVAHADGDRSNPRLGNLRWATREQNRADMVCHGTVRHRDEYKHAKYATSDIAEMARLNRMGKSQAEVAKMFGTSRSYISKLIAAFKRGDL